MSLAEASNQLDSDEPQTPLWFTALGLGLFLFGGIFLLATQEESEVEESHKNEGGGEAAPANEVRANGSNPGGTPQPPPTPTEKLNPQRPIKPGSPTGLPTSKLGTPPSGQRIAQPRRPSPQFKQGLPAAAAPQRKPGVVPTPKPPTVTPPAPVDPHAGHDH